MKKTLLFFSALVCFLLVAGCGKDGEEKPPPASTAVQQPLTNTAEEKAAAPIPLDQYTLTYTAGKNGSIAGVSSQKVESGGAGSLVTAVPAAGHYFVSWSDGVATASRTDSKVTADLVVTANFAPHQYTLTYTAGNNGTIEGAGLQKVDHGGDASAVTAVPAKGYHFVRWDDGVATPQRLDAKITGNRTVSAVFAINIYTVGGRVSGLIEGAQVVLQNNGGDNLTITANGNFNFSAESHDGNAYDVRVLAQPTSPKMTCVATRNTGTISGENVTNVEVACVPVTFTVGGTVTGLPDKHQVVLRVNEGKDLRLSADGAFTFATPLNDGSKYEVKVHGQPKKPNWTCAVEKGSGVVTEKNVTDVVVNCYPEAILRATAGLGKINLQWNSQDFSDATFSLCRAQENIPGGGFSKCKVLKGGVLKTKLKSPLTVSKLNGNTPYWFQLEVLSGAGQRIVSEVVMEMPFGGLNDSGIDWCADETTNRITAGMKEKSETCNAMTSTYPGQDAMYGRDASARAGKLAKTGAGSAGFDFTKLCRSGEAAGKGKCPANPKPGNGFDNWACTLDNVTGLIWEIKADSGLRGKSNTYTWYNPDGKANGGEPGLKNGGSCEGSGCDTQAYVKAINEQGLCGVSDWRLPTRSELLSIVDNGRSNPAIDARFFPDVSSSYYWSSSSAPDQTTSAWQVYFRYGEASPDTKRKSNHLRLVRGRLATSGQNKPKKSGEIAMIRYLAVTALCLMQLAVLFRLPAGAAQTCKDSIAPTTRDASFILHNDGTATDITTGLTWMRCSLGQEWNGKTCSGNAAIFSWSEGLKAAAGHKFAGHADWRMPNKNELESLVEGRCHSPAINAKVFPETPSAYFWSSSPYVALPSAAWNVDFGYGAVNASVKSGAIPVRLVRDGE